MSVCLILLRKIRQDFFLTKKRKAILMMENKDKKKSIKEFKNIYIYKLIKEDKGKADICIYLCVFKLYVFNNKRMVAR